MELEILNKLKKEAEALDARMGAMPESTALDRISKESRSTFVDGFCAAVDLIDEIINENHEQMARDYGQDGKDADVTEKV